MKVTIIFHSVCGNTYLMAKTFADSFVGKGKDVQLLRVADSELQKTAAVLPSAQEYLEKLLHVPVAQPDLLADSDIIVLGSPTYYGNVSGQFKIFMDKTMPLWLEGKLKGKKIIAFASAANAEGGGDLCLQTIHTYAQHMGMLSVPVPAFLVPGISCSAYGILHYSGPKADQRPDQVKTLISEYVDYVLSL